MERKIISFKDQFKLLTRFKFNLKFLTVTTTNERLRNISCTILVTSAILPPPSKWLYSVPHKTVCKDCACAVRMWSSNFNC